MGIKLSWIPRWRMHHKPDQRILIQYTSIYRTWMVVHHHPKHVIYCKSKCKRTWCKDTHWPGNKFISSYKKCVDKLRLSSSNADQLLNVKTLTGTKQVTSSKVKIPFHDGVYLNAYVLDSNLVLDSDKNINVGSLWPNLDKQLAKKAKTIL